MKISTWIDRLAGVILALAIARMLGPQALGEWTLVLLTVWILSPWPESTLTTRLGAGLLGLAGVAIVSWIWHGSWERHALLWAIALGMLAIRTVHALPTKWPWRMSAFAASFLAGLVTLAITKSVLATHTALAITAGVAAIVGCLRFHNSLGRFSTISWITWGESLVMMLLQAQAILWVYARGLSETAIGELAAAFFLLEFLKGGLVILTLRFDKALTHFSQTRESFLETVRSMTAYSLLVMPPMVLAVFFVTGPLVNTVLGSEFSESVPLIRLLIWGFGLSFLSLMGTRVLAAKHKKVFAARIVAGLLEAALDWLWIPQMGLEGACYAHVAGEVLAFILIAFQVCHGVPDLINPFRKTYG
jgi:O-antigen/teichoic acid export membrane protein